MTPEEWFHRLATHYVEAQIYFHLNQSGVFEKLRDGAPPDAIARELELDERILRTLLEYVAAVGEIVGVDDDGGFRLTEFGRDVTKRYSKTNGDRVIYNMFDVRIGAWGPVWDNLGDLLRKSKVYGVDVHRAGEHAADGLFKLAAPLAETVGRIADRLNATSIVELGPTSGILAQLAVDDHERQFAGVDIKPESLTFADDLARERGVDRITWKHGNAFTPADWIDELSRGQRVMYFSCHFHEFLASGESVVEAALRQLTAHPSTAGVLVLEQPRLEAELRDRTSPTRWLYAQSHVLIHHLIKNARILYGSEWEQLLRRGGCREVWVEGTKGFGFDAYVGVAHA